MMNSDWTLSVDFGTTSTAGAMSATLGRADEIVEIGDSGDKRMPSVVCWKAAVNGTPGRLLVGDSADNESWLSPEATVRCPKYKVGQEFLTLGDEKVRVTDVIGAIIRHVLDQAVARQGGRAPIELRLTHPQRWAQARLGQLREAAAVAGFPEPEFVAEPVAAAIYFASKGQIADGERVAVYDLGGGTFDTAVLERAGDTFEVVGAGGIEDLGGEDFDEKLYRYLSDRISPELWARLDEVEARRRLQDFRREVRRAKERLSREPDATIRSPVPGHRDLQVTVPEFEDLIRADVERTVDVLQETIAQANSGKGVSGIYVAGGSSRIPLVSRILSERLGRPPSMFGDPKAVTALGALRAPIVKPPTLVRAPVVTGKARVGETLAVEAGTFSSSMPVEEHVEWQRRVPGDVECVVVGLGTTVKLTEADRGHEVRARVTGTNPAGSSTGHSAWSASVGAPTVPGTAGTAGTAGTSAAAGAQAQSTSATSPAAQQAAELGRLTGLTVLSALLAIAGGGGTIIMALVKNKFGFSWFEYDISFTLLMAFSGVAFAIQGVAVLSRYRIPLHVMLITAAATAGFVVNFVWLESDNLHSAAFDAAAAASLACAVALLPIVLRGPVTAVARSWSVLLAMVSLAGVLLVGLGVAIHSHQATLWHEVLNLTRIKIPVVCVLAGVGYVAVRAWHASSVKWVVSLGAVCALAFALVLSQTDWFYIAHNPEGPLGQLRTEIALMGIGAGLFLVAAVGSIVLASNPEGLSRAPAGR